MPDHEQVPQPLTHEPTEPVMNVYPLPGTETAPDFRSQDEMGQYLLERFEPEEGARWRVVLEASGHTMPSIHRVPNGEKEVTRLRRTDDWLISPKAALAAIIGSFLLFNGASGDLAKDAEFVAGLGHRIGHDVYRIFDPVESTKKVVSQTTHEPGKIVDIKVSSGVASTDVTGSKISVNDQEISSLRQKIKVLTDKGGKVKSVQVVGETSNDWGAKGDRAFGISNVENQQLGKQVAKAAYEDVKSQLTAAGLAQTPTSFGQHETVLSKSVAANLITEAKANGYDSLESAVKAVDHGTLRGSKLYQRIKTFITSKRDESIDVKVAVPGKTHTHITKKTVTVPGVDHEPHVPKPGFSPFIPIPYLRRRERYQTMKPKNKWQFTPSAEIMVPTIIREEADQAWLRIRPEAVKPDGTLVDNSWAFTRKYEHLLRDGRIAEVLRGDFKNPEGKDKSLRIMFVDETPAQETVDTFGELLTKFAAMDNGKISDRVSAIFVYPSENTGTAHMDEKRIALGIDKQSAENIAGTYTYILDLVELHVPTKVGIGELEALMASFDGPAWTLAHEVAGHGTDDSDAPLRLRRVVSRQIPNAHIIEGDPQAQKMKPMQKVLAKLPKRGRRSQKAKQESPIEFDVTYRAIDDEGQVITMPVERVTEHDSRLKIATQATIIGYQPTEYSNTNSSEHYAETAAAVTTGISVPYTEADVVVDFIKTDAGQQAVFRKRGYRPDVRGQQVFTRSIGAIDGVFPAAFNNPPEVTISRTSTEDDPLIQQQLIRTRRLQTLTAREMVAILARVTRRIRS